MTKNTILAILKKNNDYISGEKISKELNISRAAVNLSIKNLRKEGYNILSSTNKGYKLNNDPDLLNKGEFINILGTNIKRVIVLESVDSTNNYLKKLALEKAKDGQIVVANEQTKGRGRMGRDFICSKGKGIYLSYLIRPNITLANIIGITAWASVAVCNAIEKVYGIYPKIKWVNDILLNDKKISGILTEAVVEDNDMKYMIIGIGINVNEESFPDEIKNIASSLYLETNKKINRIILIDELIKQLDIMNKKWPNDEEYYNKYINNSIVLNNEIRVIKGNHEIEAKVISIDKDFALVLEDGNRINSGEISIRKK